MPYATPAHRILLLLFFFSFFFFLSSSFFSLRISLTWLSTPADGLCQRYCSSCCAMCHMSVVLILAFLSPGRSDVKDCKGTCSAFYILQGLLCYACTGRSSFCKLLTNGACGQNSFRPLHYVFRERAFQHSYFHICAQGCLLRRSRGVAVDDVFEVAACA